MAAHSAASLGVEQLKSDSRNHCTDNDNIVAPVTRASLNIHPMTVLFVLFYFVRVGIRDMVRDRDNA